MKKSKREANCITVRRNFDGNDDHSPTTANAQRRINIVIFRIERLFDDT